MQKSQCRFWLPACLPGCLSSPWYNCADYHWSSMMYSIGTADQKSMKIHCERRISLYFSCEHIRHNAFHTHSIFLECSELGSIPTSIIVLTNFCHWSNNNNNLFTHTQHTHIIEIRHAFFGGFYCAKGSLRTAQCVHYCCVCIGLDSVRQYSDYYSIHQCRIVRDVEEQEQHIDWKLSDEYKATHLGDMAMEPPKMMTLRMHPHTAHTLDRALT